MENEMEQFTESVARLAESRAHLLGVKNFLETRKGAEDSFGELRIQVNYSSHITLQFLHLGTDSVRDMMEGVAKAVEESLQMVEGALTGLMGSACAPEEPNEAEDLGETDPVLHNKYDGLHGAFLGRKGGVTYGE